MPIFKLENKELIKKLNKHFKEVEVAIEEAKKFVRSIKGATDNFVVYDTHHFGGVYGINFKKEVPEGYIKNRGFGSGYRPNAKTNKDLYREWYSLPTVRHENINRIFSFKGYMNPKSCSMQMNIGVQKAGKTWVLSVQDYVVGEWEIPEGVVEITYAELELLKKGTKNKKVVANV